MAVGLLLMFLTVMALFGGAPVGAGLFLGLLGIGALLGGWLLSDRNSPHPVEGEAQS